MKIDVNGRGHLMIGGADAVELAKRFGTPLYVFDEARIRNMMRVYKSALDREYGGHGKVLYASKAFSCLAMYKIAQSEGLGADVVSGGEFYTAVSAGFPACDVCMHGNNKTLEELKYALDNKIGTVVLDSQIEADVLDVLAAERNIVQDVLIRINPGVEAHTHEYVQTAKTDSKFGFSVSDGAALRMTAHVAGKNSLRFMGYHCHIGSQIFEKQSFAAAASKVLDFMAIAKHAGYEAEVLNLGGGFGVWYNSDDPELGASDYEAFIKTVTDEIKRKCGELGLKLPYLELEPGRSIVGAAGTTLYTVGAIKEIPGIRKYVAVDGGMFENPRYALYKSKYTVLLAGRAGEKCTEKVTVAGKCCESGDIIAVDAPLPEARTGDIMAVLTTGAYNYSMASNYNRNPVPPAVLVCDGEADYIVKPQTYEDMIRNDAIPERLK